MTATTRSHLVRSQAGTPRLCARALAFLEETWRCYRRPLLAVAAVFLVSGGVSFGFGLEYKAFVEREEANARRASASYVVKVDFAGFKMRFPQAFDREPPKPTWSDRAWKGVNEGAELFVPLAFYAAAFTLIAIISGCAFGVVPIVLAGVTGMALGFGLRWALAEVGAVHWLCITALLTPALLLVTSGVLVGAAIGLRLGATIAQKHMATWWQGELRRGLKAWACLVLPMLAFGTCLQIAVVAAVYGLRGN